MSNITTRTGDTGSTDIKGYRVKKNSSIMNLIGDLDEAQAHIIYAYTLDNERGGSFPNIVENLVKISAIIAGYKEVSEFPTEEINLIEEAIEERGALTFDWVYPFNNSFMAQCNVARTVVRRAERSAYGELNEAEFNTIKIYLNRLSDLLFTYTSDNKWR